ncbi:hypothetical protein CN563_15325 [Bacillus sp. AFS026049]|nr:hypothetical protein CON84_26170 [Bacillus sp. AFS094228]PEO46028.1 hypothetical protein CN563_15325 [Bacillus sp. AFS026049]
MDYGLWQVSCRRLFYSNKGHKINRTRHNKNELYKGRFYIGVKGNLEKCTFFIFNVSNFITKCLNGRKL